MAKSRKAAAAAVDTPEAPEAVLRAAPPLGVVIPAPAGATLHEFSRAADGTLDDVVLAVLAWWIAGTEVEPVTLAPARPRTVRCVVESHGSAMTYTFLDAPRTRFATITDARAHALALLEA